MDDLISRKAAIEEFEDMVRSVSVYGESAEARYTTNARIRFIEKLNSIPTVPAVPIDPLAVWLAGYHVSPPEYALKETGALNPIDPASTVFTPNQIATAWAYHLQKLVESGLMG